MARIDGDGSSRSPPLAWIDLLYTSREHIKLVREQLRDIDTSHDKENKE